MRLKAGHDLGFMGKKLPTIRLGLVSCQHGYAQRIPRATFAAIAALISFRTNKRTKILTCCADPAGW